MAVALRLLALPLASQIRRGLLQVLGAASPIRREAEAMSLLPAAVLPLVLLLGAVLPPWVAAGILLGLAVPLAVAMWRRE